MSVFLPIELPLNIVWIIISFFLSKYYSINNNRNGKPTSIIILWLRFTYLPNWYEIMWWLLKDVIQIKNALKQKKMDWASANRIPTRTKCHHQTKWDHTLSGSFDRHTNVFWSKIFWWIPKKHCKRKSSIQWWFCNYLKSQEYRSYLPEPNSMIC